jgi:hypothetical protein
MRWAAKTVASAAWVFARAVSASDGTTATVVYGERATMVTGLVGPHRVPSMVREFEARDGTERFCDAVDALDGALRLSDPSAGARLLVVFSDGMYEPEERVVGQAKITRLIRNGCGVLWISKGRAKPMDGAVHVSIDDPSSAVELIGAAAEAALLAAGR